MPKIKVKSYSRDFSKKKLPPRGPKGRFTKKKKTTTKKKRTTTPRRRGGQGNLPF